MESGRQPFLSNLENMSIALLWMATGRTTPLVPAAFRMNSEAGILSELWSERRKQGLATLVKGNIR